MSNINTAKLHRLIVSLKKEEKRYFKLFTQKQNQKGEVLYLKIFSYLEKLDEVDRDNFKKRFKGVKGLSGLQTYLYKLILKSLRSQSIHDDIESTLKEGLIDLDILYKKELFTDTYEKVQELLEIAKLYDKIFFLPMLYEWWFTLENAHLRYHNVELPLLKEYTMQYAQVIEDLKHYNFYRTQISSSLFLMKGKGIKQISEEIKVVSQNLPEYDSNQKKYGFSVVLQELQLRSFLAAICLDTQACFFYSKELSSLLKRQPKEVFKTYESFYYNALNNQSFSAPNTEALNSIIEQIEAGIKEKEKEKDVDFYNQLSRDLFIIKVDLYLLTRAFKDFEQFVEDNPKIIKYLTSMENDNLRNLWHYKMMLYHYAVKNYTDALSIFDQYLIDKTVANILKSPSLFLKMVIYYEQEEFALLDSFLHNFPRILMRKKALLNPEKQLVSLMNKLIKQPKSEHKMIFIKARKEMMDYLDTIDESKKEFFMYFNYIGWIDSQITGRPFKNLFFRHTGIIQFSE